jgi:hypothetical protein
VSKADPRLANSYYLRDDGVLMIQARPGHFINETVAAGFGLVPADIERIRGELERRAGKKPSKAKTPSSSRSRPHAHSRP